MKGPYKVEESLLETDDDKFIKRWYITQDCIPVYAINAFIESRSIIKPNTGKKYAYSLIKYLNYLNTVGKHYDEASVVDVNNYLKIIMYGGADNIKIKSLDFSVTLSTLKGDITAITEFYKYLKKQETNMVMTFETERKRNRKLFLYGQIFEFDYSKIVDKYIGNLKPSKEYIKWYINEEKEAILSHLRTLRDKAMFSLQLEGMRVDEMLSVRLSDYDEIEQIVQPSRSKGRLDALSEKNTLRNVALPDRTAKILSDYIFTERVQAENESGKFSDYLFVNLRRGENQGEPVGYHNYLKILKRAAKGAGFDPMKIRSHSGRSTKVNELLEHQAIHPEDNITDFMIKEIMGWKSMESIEPYKNYDNKTIAKSASKKINRRKLP